MRAVTFADTGRCRRELVRGAIDVNAVVMLELPPSPANMKLTRVKAPAFLGSSSAGSPS